MMHNIKWVHAFFFLAITVIVFNVFAASSFGINLPHDISRPREDNPDQEDMVLIPAGEFIMGSISEEVQPVIKEFGKRGDFIEYNFEREKPLRKIYVGAFYIDRYEVTNAQYKKFIDATGHKPPHHWMDGTYPSGKDNHPII